jgi:hypothetical protein
MLVIGGGETLFALLLGAVHLPYAFNGGLWSVATAFQLLAALAMPHQSIGLCLKLCHASMTLSDKYRASLRHSGSMN